MRLVTLVPQLLSVMLHSIHTDILATLTFPPSHPPTASKAENWDCLCWSTQSCILVVSSTLTTVGRKETCKCYFLQWFSLSKLNNHKWRGGDTTGSYWMLMLHSVLGLIYFWKILSRGVQQIQQRPRGTKTCKYQLVPWPKSGQSLL